MGTLLPYFPPKIKSEHRDVVIHVSGELALVHAVHHFIADPPDHPSGQTWMRVTTGFRKLSGQWKVVHEHVSIPFNPMDNKAWFITDPNKLDAPDYSAGCQGDSK